METLDKILDSFVEKNYAPTEMSEKDEKLIASLSINSMRDALKEEIKKRVISEVVEAKKKELDEYSKQMVAEERRNSSILAIKELIWEAFVLSIFVGLLGNEITTLIEFFKSFGGEDSHAMITVILIVVYAVIVVAIYVIKFTKDVINTFVKKPKK